MKKLACYSWWLSTNIVIPSILVLLLLNGCSTPASRPTLPPTATSAPISTPALPPTVMLTPTSIPTLPPTSTPPPPPTSPPTAPPLPFQEEEISLTTSDNAKLAATLFSSQGKVAVVLAHMGIADQRTWRPFARTIAGRGFTAITFDFRCYGQSECSGGKGDTLATDVRAAIEFLRKRGIEHIVCMGASMGGQACMSAALDEELAGLVVIASPAAVRPDKRFPEDLVSPDMPKLFIVADRDRYSELTLVIPAIYESAPAPKELKTFASAVHGTELFKTEYGNEFRELLVNFLEKLD
jgi:pimeloyl-ACP methyl ester carboxylesterase